MFSTFTQTILASIAVIGIIIFYQKKIKKLLIESTELVSKNNELRDTLKKLETQFDKTVDAYESQRKRYTQDHAETTDQMLGLLETKLKLENEIKVLEKKNAEYFEVVRKRTDEKISLETQLSELVADHTVCCSNLKSSKKNAAEAQKQHDTFKEGLLNKLVNLPTPYLESLGVTEVQLSAPDEDVLDLIDNLVTYINTPPVKVRRKKKTDVES